MNKSFHYSTIKVLARYAGFSERDSQTIAYASQYVDDADAFMWKKLHCTPPNWVQKDANLYDNERNSFNPTCTAHKSIYQVLYQSRAAQLKVLVPFHFLPDRMLDADNIGYEGEDKFVTKENGLLAKYILYDAIFPLSRTTNYATKDLVRLGIALHSYADTWAHQGFSGLNSDYNDIEEVSVKSRNEWEKKYTNYVNNIGHGEALSYPDDPTATWRYTYDDVKNITKAKTERQNYKIMLDAAKKIFSEICIVTRKKDIDATWQEICIKLKAIYTLKKMDEAEMCNLFTYIFDDIEFNYNQKEWEHAANFNADEKWFFFHKLAREQRELVVGKHI